jgi:hypothetical protein
LPDDSVVAEIRDIVSAEQIASGDPIRAVDALLVVERLDAAIGDRLSSRRQKS